MTSEYKYKVAESYGVHSGTLRRWLLPFMSDLQARGYKARQKKFTPEQLKIIHERLGTP